MEPNSKILFNIGLIHAANGYHEDAVTNFNAATGLDTYLAIAYFQCGVSNFLLGRYQFAYKDFDVAFKHLRENQWIDYEQLGLKFKLWSAEVLYNRGLCLIYMNQLDNGMRDLQAAKREKQVPDHDVIDDAIAAQGRQFTVFSLQEGVLFRPAADKVKNLKTKNYMGTAKLVAATEEKDAFTEFVGVKRKEQGLGPAGQLLLGQDSGPPPPRKQSDPSPLPARSDSPAGGLGRSRTIADRYGDNSGRPGRVQTPPRPDGDMDSGMQGRPRPQRSNTVGVAGGGARPAMNGMPTRGLSVRGRGDAKGDGPNGVRGFGAASRDRSQPGAAMEQQRPPPPRPASPPLEQRPTPPVSKGLGPPRMNDTVAPLQVRRPSAKEENRGVMTQIYEDYLGIGGGGNGAEEIPPPAQSQPQSQDPLSRVAAWQQRTIPGASPNVPPSRTPSQRGGGGGGGSVLNGRKTPSRNNTIPGIRVSNGREDDDEGGSSVTEIVPFEQMKIRVKIHYDDDTRGMAVYPSTPFDEFVEMVTIKFKKGWNNLNCKFMDTDGSKVSLKDEMDWDMAIEVARESVKGRGEAKLDMWMVDR
ncbi:hypothetical protein FRC04_000805 [Tulasnella sp. 424]|nr:hypothetical protein FRC04_000805 [Tulasnella sp. 424]